MPNRVTHERIDTLTREYQRLAREHSEALEQIALAELPEAVQQSNAIENSTLSIEDTERILDGQLPSRQLGLREVFEARNLAAVISSVFASDEPTSIGLILH